MQDITSRERQKLEATIEEAVEAQVSEYRQDRIDDRRQLLIQLRNDPSKDVKKLMEQFGTLAVSLAGYGYEFKVSYSVNDEVEIVVGNEHPTLTEYDRETDKVVASLKGVKRRFVIRLYTATDGTDILADLMAEVEKVLKETAKRTCPVAQVPRLVQFILVAASKSRYD